MLYSFAVRPTAVAALLDQSSICPAEPLNTVSIAPTDCSSSEAPETASLKKPPTFPTTHRPAEIAASGPIARRVLAKNSPPPRFPAGPRLARAAVGSATPKR